MTSVAAARHQWEEAGAASRARATTSPGRGSWTCSSRPWSKSFSGALQTFTLHDLANVYGGAEDWVRGHPRLGPANARAGIRDTALVQDAAFAHYAQGARDYRPEMSTSIGSTSPERSGERRGGRRRGSSAGSWARSSSPPCSSRASPSVAPSRASLHPRTKRWCVRLSPPPSRREKRSRLRFQTRELGRISRVW